MDSVLGALRIMLENRNEDRQYSTIKVTIVLSRGFYGNTKEELTGTLKRFPK